MSNCCLIILFPLVIYCLDTNGTSGPEILENLTFVWRFIAGSVVLFIGVLGNLTTCFVILCTRRLHTPTYTVIAMLALSDFMALSVRFVDTYYDLYMDLFIEVYFIIWGFVYFTLHASCAHIILLFYVRYRLIVSPLVSLGNLTCLHALKISMYLWTISLIFGYSYGCFSYYVDLSRSGSKPVTLATAYVVDGTIALLLIAIPIIVIALFHFKKRMILRISNSTSAVRLSKKMAIIVMIVITIHCASILPFCVYAWLEVYIQTYGPMNLNVDVKLYRDVSIAMFFLNHTINLIIYFICSVVRRSDASPRQTSYAASPDTRSVSANLSIISRNSDVPLST